MTNKAQKLINKSIRAFHHARGSYPVKIDGLAFECNADHYRFWKRVAQGKWEPHTFKILSRFLTPDSVYCDIGAWIGPTVMFAARKCKLVYCFEPNPVSYSYLLWHIHGNKLWNVLPFQLALADTEGIQRMAPMRDKGGLGDSTASLLSTGTAGMNIFCMRWATWQKMIKPEKIDFFKIDIEGSEFSLLPEMESYLKQHRPILYLSTHAHLLDANKSKNAMKGLLQILDFYQDCFDENLKRVDKDHLITDDVLGHSCSYVFTG